MTEETKDPRVMITRPDGRPETYDMLPAGVAVGCLVCAQKGRPDKVFKSGEIVMTSPIDAGDGQAHWVCIEHLPDNVVIFNPKDNLCRDKTGQNVWRE
jgi:hypothetical protein